MWTGANWRENLCELVWTVVCTNWNSAFNLGAPRGMFFFGGWGLRKVHCVVSGSIFFIINKYSSLQSFSSVVPVQFVQSSSPFMPFFLTGRLYFFGLKTQLYVHVFLFTLCLWPLLLKTPYQLQPLVWEVSNSKDIAVKYCPKYHQGGGHYTP